MQFRKLIAAYFHNPIWLINSESKWIMNANKLLFIFSIEFIYK